MQYHQNGFRPGDPTIQPEKGSKQGDPDVLIVGCGPAGLTLAAYLSQFPAIRTRIVERKDGPLEMGQADGIACRSMEMFQVFGFAHKVLQESYWVNETTFWAAPEGVLTRTGRIQDVEDGLSEMPHVILSQARIHDFFLEVMRHSPTRLEPDYATAVTGLEVTETHSLVHLDTPQGPETVRARYVVGCDGARSQVRQALGLALRGDSANAAWGVMDVLAVSDFPDIRYKSVVRSASDGTVLVIPREGGHMVRLYTEMGMLQSDQRVSEMGITAEAILDKANRIFAPYTLDVREIAWWSAYEIGQRVADAFTDQVGEEPRVFIAGDACHTHSPKAGQGMNVSMADAFNLGWKLAAVIEGRANAKLLGTYASERRQVAQDLIAFDRDFARKISETGDFESHFKAQGLYTAGLATRYAPSQITGAGSGVGERFPSSPVIRLCDAKRIELGHVFAPDAVWRLFGFLPRDWRTVLPSFTALAERFLNLDLRLILQPPHHAITEPVQGIFAPLTGSLGLCDLERVFCAAPDVDVFDLRGIDREAGALVLVRSDQYVSLAVPASDTEAIAELLDGIMPTSSRTTP